MALVITKKVRTILLIVLGIIVVSAGGFLIWRVTQEESVAPTDSEAYVDDPKDCQCICGRDVKDAVYVPGGGYSCVYSDCTNEDYGYGPCGCYGFGDEYGDCYDVEYQGNGGTCTPSNLVVQTGKPPAVTVSCTRIGYKIKSFTKVSGTASLNSSNGTLTNVTSDVIVKANWVQTVVNTCEGGSWANRPSGEYPYGTELNPIVIKTTDPDGLGAVTVKVNGNSVPTCGPTTGVTCYKKNGKNIEVYIDPGQEYIGAGNYGMTVTWKDGKDVGGEACTKSTTFTILEEVVDAACSARAKVYSYEETEWTPAEVGFCKVGSTATPNYDQLSSSFPEPGETVSWVCKNSAGSVDCQASRADINDPVCSARAKVYSYEETEWTPAEVGFCKVGSTATPNYDQLSSSFPEPGETVSWVCSNADGSVNCEASRIDSAGGIPQTGIFDTVLGRVSVGVSFIFLGGLVSQYSRINYFFNSVSEKNQFRREINKQRRKEKRIQRRREKLEDNFKGK